MENNTQDTARSQAADPWGHPYDNAVKYGNFHIGQDGHQLTTIGAHTGHTCVPVAFCARESVARHLLDAVMQRDAFEKTLEAIRDHYDMDGYEDQDPNGNAWKTLALEMAESARAAIAKARGEV